MTRINVLSGSSAYERWVAHPGPGKRSAAMLQISPEKICYVVVKAREFEVPEDVVETNPASDAVDDNFRSVLAAYADDPTYQELKEFLDNLNVDEQADMVALTWLGRGDYEAGDWSTAVLEAKARHTGSTTDYLLGTPLLPDLLEEGLNALGYSCDEYEKGHL
jgi:hypothetical protein